MRGFRRPGRPRPWPSSRDVVSAPSGRRASDLHMRPRPARCLPVLSGRAGASEKARAPVLAAPVHLQAGILDLCGDKQGTTLFGKAASKAPTRITGFRAQHPAALLRVSPCDQCGRRDGHQFLLADGVGVVNRDLSESRIAASRRPRRCCSARSALQPDLRRSDTCGKRAMTAAMCSARL